MAANPESPEAFNLQASLAETYDGLVTKLVQSLPDLLGAILLIIVGWLVASGVRIAVRKMITGLDSLLHPMLGGEGGRTTTLRYPVATIVGRIAFWSVMLFFIAAATNLIGWSLFTDWTQNVVQFLPQLVTGLLIIFAGVLLGSVVKTIVTRTAASAKLQKPELIGRISQLAVIFTMGVIGVEQLGINVHFLTESLIVFIGVFLAGGALAFGLGARALAANVIGAQNCRKLCRIGQEVTIKGVAGTVTEITSTSIVLETATGQAIVPASLFDENISLIGSQPMADSPAKETASPDAKEERAS